MLEQLVLKDTYNACVEAKSERAIACGGMFATRCETPQMFVKRLWELYGDTREFISSTERLVALQLAIDDINDARLNVPGMLEFASSLVALASGIPAFMAACDAALRGEGVDADALSDGERAALAMAGRYYEVIRTLGRIEPGEAVLHLWEGGEAFARPLSVINECDAPLPLVLEEVFEASESIDYTPRARDEEALGRVRDGVDLSFAFPSGGYATSALLCEIVENSDAADIVVSAPDPLRAYSECAQALVARGVRVSGKGPVLVADTVVGRMLLALNRGFADAKGRAHDICPVTLKTALVDAARSPYVGMGDSEVFELDRVLRADRIMTTARALELAHAASEELEAVCRVGMDPSDMEVLGALRKTAASRFFNDSLALEAELSTVGALEIAARMTRIYDASRQVPLRALARGSITLACESLPEGEAVRQVRFMSIAEASHAGDSECEMLVCLGLDSDSYPLATKDDAATTLLAKLGIDARRDAVTLARRQFKRLLGTAKRKVVLSRPLFDANANETYPCAMLEEVVDAYRDDVTRTDDIDNAYALPPELAAHIVERGEETLYANALGDPEAHQAGKVFSGHATLGVPPVSVVDGKPLLTPSSMETYLSCPRRWLVERTTSADRLDEAFSQLEMGSYRHAVLERYHTLCEGPTDALSPERRAEYMEQAIRETREEQPELEPNKGRLVAATELEEREVASCERSLRTWPEFEAKLLSGFAPKHLEYELSPTQGVEYAGCVVCGRVDRIDVDAQGNAVVIDYKGSLDGEYSALGDEGFELGRVQALIYATAVGRATGLVPAGALYVSYSTHGVYGAYDESVTRLSEDEDARGKADALPHAGAHSFEALLASCEEYVGEGVKRLLAGDFEANPRSKSSCSYCPVSGCERRLS